MKKVLLTSASKVFLDRNKTLLLKKGLDIFSAASGAQALEMHERAFFDLILADLELEDMSGCKLCSMIRSTEGDSQVPVILICHNLPGSMEMARKSGATTILVKPIDPTRLLETIGSFLELQITRSRRVPLSVKVPCRKGGQEFISLSHEISDTGILLETARKLDIGSRLHCQLELPGSCRIEAEAEVIRPVSPSRHDNLYGLKFVDISHPSQRAINQFVISSENSKSGATADGVINPGRAAYDPAEFQRE